MNNAVAKGAEEEIAATIDTYLKAVKANDTATLRGLFCGRRQSCGAWAGRRSRTHIPAIYLCAL
jgi:hypothetical protein